MPPPRPHPVSRPGPPKVALLIESSNSYGRELLHSVRDWERAHGPWLIRLTEEGRGAGAPSWLRHWDGDGIIARVESRQFARALRATGLPVIDVSAGLSQLTETWSGPAVAAAALPKLSARRGIGARCSRRALSPWMTWWSGLPIG